MYAGIIKPEFSQKWNESWLINFRIFDTYTRTLTPSETSDSDCAKKLELKAGEIRLFLQLTHRMWHVKFNFFFDICNRVPKRKNGLISCCAQQKCCRNIKIIVESTKWKFHVAVLYIMHFVFSFILRFCGILSFYFTFAAACTVRWPMTFSWFLNLLISFLVHALRIINKTKETQR